MRQPTPPTVPDLAHGTEIAIGVRQHESPNASSPFSCRRHGGPLTRRQGPRGPGTGTGDVCASCGSCPTQGRRSAAIFCHSRNGGRAAALIKSPGGGTWGRMHSGSALFCSVPHVPTLPVRWVTGPIEKERDRRGNPSTCQHLLHLHHLRHHALWHPSSTLNALQLQMPKRRS